MPPRPNMISGSEARDRCAAPESIRAAPADMPRSGIHRARCRAAALDPRGDCPARRCGGRPGRRSETSMPPTSVLWVMAARHRLHHHRRPIARARPPLRPIRIATTAPRRHREFRARASSAFDSGSDSMTRPSARRAARSALRDHRWPPRVAQHPASPLSMIDAQDDLAELLGDFEVAMRLGSLVQRERRGR